jgi:hypothetical protein
MRALENDRVSVFEGSFDRYVMIIIYKLIIRVNIKNQISIWVVTGSQVIIIQYIYSIVP